MSKEKMSQLCDKHRQLQISQEAEMKEGMEMFASLANLEHLEFSSDDEKS